MNLTRSTLEELQNGNTGHTLHARTHRESQICSKLDKREYETGRNVDDATFQALNMARRSFHREWNDIVKPQFHT